MTRLDDDLLAPESPVATELTVIGDGALMAALTRKRGTVMHDIVATIQREQDLAVRSPGDGATLITGGPGTGRRPWPCTARPICCSTSGGASSPAAC